MENLDDLKKYYESEYAKEVNIVYNKLLSRFSKAYATSIEKNIPLSIKFNGSKISAKREITKIIKYFSDREEYEKCETLKIIKNSF